MGKRKTSLNDTFKQGLNGTEESQDAFSVADSILNGEKTKKAPQSQAQKRTDPSQKKKPEYANRPITASFSQIEADAVENLFLKLRSNGEQISKSKILRAAVMLAQAEEEKFRDWLKKVPDLRRSEE